MPPLYPLVFRPVFKRYLWGGRRLGTVLGKPIGEGNDYAESWEIADHEHGQSIVANGPLAGASLHELVTTRGEELLGRHHPQSRFPLIFKYLDCQRDLSVQVHPDDAAAANLTPPDLGKTEAWVVLHAEPGSRIYAGLKAGCDKAKLRAALAEGSIEQWLHSFEPQEGDCVFIPAGTVHALGAGLLVAEIQQASDTTYRLYDWGRLGPDGKPRELHVEPSLAAIDYSAVHMAPQQPKTPGEAECLVACDEFVFNRRTLRDEMTFNLDNAFDMLSVLEGEVIVEAEPGSVTLARGQTILLPACLGHASLHPQGQTILLEMHLPVATLQPRSSS
jgi:mannose-6-phosphate isomerase